MADIFDLFRQISQKNTAPKEPISWLIVGLGNPGEEYRSTRHNAGFLTIDSLAEQLGLHIDRMKFHALTTEASIGSSRVLLMKPMTLMNASGIAVSEAAAFYKIPADHILVISDDINLAPGRMRLRKNGSAGGQKGLKSIIEKLGTQEFPRLRMGVGAKPHPDYDLASWVLSNFSKEEMEALRSAIGGAEAGIRLLLEGRFEQAVQHCNSHNAKEA
ncbi:MAG: aminoacyl-tRNA hydrolase [Ruminococcaceae bacterium]|nr:aminoacyl-tRNA hydrolase [Oscillospiraceae bacterium]